MIECVVNISEGKNSSTLSALKKSCQTSLLDIHIDSDHNRSVFTLAHSDPLRLENSVRKLAQAAITLIDISEHKGEHPRIGVVDVVPFVALPNTDSTHKDAINYRDRFAIWMSETFDMPCFLYGMERSLPFIRKHAFKDLQPDTGPLNPHPTAGACAVGARKLLVAYNLWLKSNDVTLAKEIAASIRGSGIRSIGLNMNGQAQVSCNLIDPLTTGPDIAYDRVAGYAQIERTELVGLIPTAVLENIPQSRWEQLDISPEKTIESRLEQLLTD